MIDPCMPLPLLNQNNLACYHSISLITLYKMIVLLHGNPLASIYLCIIAVRTQPLSIDCIVLNCCFKLIKYLRINLPNWIGKIKTKQDMHVCIQDLCIAEASNHSNILLPKVRRLKLIYVPRSACIFITWLLQFCKKLYMY